MHIKKNPFVLGLGAFLQCLLKWIPYTFLWHSLLHIATACNLGLGKSESHTEKNNQEHKSKKNYKYTSSQVTIDVNEVSFNMTHSCKGKFVLFFFFLCGFESTLDTWNFVQYTFFSSLFWQFITSIALKYIIRQNLQKWATNWFQLIVTVLNHFFLPAVFHQCLYSSFPVYLICVYSV